MTILDKSYFKPTSHTDLRKYISQGFKSFTPTESGKLITLRVSYSTFPRGLVLKGMNLQVPESAFRDLSVCEMNEVQFEYAIELFLKLIKGYNVYNNPITEEVQKKRIVRVANMAIDLRNWLAEHAGIPECYYSAENYLSRHQEPTLSSIDELLNQEQQNQSGQVSDNKIDQTISSSDIQDGLSQHQELLSKKVIEQRKTIQAYERNRKLLRGDVTDAEIEKLADSSRLKNGRLSYEKLSKLLRLTRQSASKLIKQRHLSHLIDPPG